MSDEDPLYRPPSGDRAILNANDWYGAGVLFELTGEGHTKARHIYCGNQGAYEQFLMGERHAQEQDIESAMNEAP